MHKKRTPPKQHRVMRLSSGLWLLCGLLVFAPFSMAQEAEPATDDQLIETVEPLVWPLVSDIAARVANPQTRMETLHDVTAVAAFLRRIARAESTVEPEALVEDRNWLARISNRYGSPRLHSPVLDPAAWLVHLSLEEQQLLAGPLTATGGAPVEILIDQVFDRSGERLASVILPELLWKVEPMSVRIWQRFLDVLSTDEQLSLAFAASRPDWLLASSGTEAPLTPDEVALAVNAAPQHLDALAASAVEAGPPDLLMLVELRYSLLMGLSSEGQDQHALLENYLRLANLLDGLHQEQYFSFAEGLLAVVSGFLVPETEPTAENPPPEPPAEQTDVPVNPVTEWLQRQLPAISNHYAKAFAQIDPRLNSALAATFAVANELTRASPDQESDRPSGEVANAAAQLALLVSDLGFYFNLPVRDPVAGGMDACIGLMAVQEADGSSAMTRELFDDCQQTLVDLADSEARAPALAGDFDGPFGTEQLQRELRVTSGQRINYGIGYLHDRYSTGCGVPDRALPNPLEFSALATLLTWFAEQSPVYFQTPENEARLQRMRNIGQELMTVVAEQVDCFAGAGAGVNDPVTRTLTDYRSALTDLSQSVDSAIRLFRSETLVNGADIQLHDDARQETAYRPEDLMIGPCDPQNVCEMTSSLTSTRALLGLFPDTILIADQSRLGSAEICYDNMAWVERRSEQVRADDTNVANYHGHLAFDLIGRYRQANEVQNVFGFRFQSPDEQHYLFAAMNDEVLNDSCPVEWVGQRIVTPLKNNRSGIVPNRLTYLAASRMLPSRLLATNWDRGAEWRDWFITGIGVEQLEVEPFQDISGEVNQHLQALYRAEQAAVYQSLLQPASRGRSVSGVPLFEGAQRLSTLKALLRQQIMLFYPQLLSESDALRRAVAGQGGLIDLLVLSRFKTENLPVETINRLGMERLENVEQSWQGQPERVRRMGSMASSLAHAVMRLNALYNGFFSKPSVAAEEPVSVVAVDG